MSDGTVLVIGAGIQGRAAIQDLDRSPDVSRVIASDVVLAPLEQHLRAIGTTKTEACSLDVRDREALTRLLSRADVAIAMVPVAFERAVAEVAIETGTPLVTTNFADAVEPLDALARDRGVTIVPEAGFDPGIDLVIVARALAEFDRIDTLNCYGAGIPAPECRQANAINYRVSWSWEGVLAAYWRAARVIVDGVEQIAAREEIFGPKWRHMVEVEGVGMLEAFVNGDAVAVAERAGIRKTVANAGRYSMRWPGHCEFWEKIAALGLLEDTPGPQGGLSPREFLRRHLEPQLQYRPGERDMIILRVDVGGMKDGRRCARRYELIDFGDPATGELAMSRAVGVPASVVAQMVMTGELRQPGVTNPIQVVPPGPFFNALAERGIRIVERAMAPAAVATV